MPKINPQMMSHIMDKKLFDAHYLELEQKDVQRLEDGDIGKHFICTNTSDGELCTMIDPKTFAITHSWNIK